MPTVNSTDLEIRDKIANQLVTRGWVETVPDSLKESLGYAIALYRRDGGYQPPGYGLEFNDRDIELLTWNAKTAGFNKFLDGHVLTFIGRCPMVNELIHFIKYHPTANGQSWIDQISEMEKNQHGRAVRTMSPMPDTFYQMYAGTPTEPPKPVPVL